MKITLGQLKQLIREQVEEVSAFDAEVMLGGGTPGGFKPGSQLDSIADDYAALAEKLSDAGDEEGAAKALASEKHWRSAASRAKRHAAKHDRMMTPGTKENEAMGRENERRRKEAGLEYYDYDTERRVRPGRAR